jgi:hypothetical protein
MLRWYAIVNNSWLTKTFQAPRAEAAVKFQVVESMGFDCVFTRATGRYQAGHVRQAHQRTAALELVRAGAPIVMDMRFVDFSVQTSEIMTIRHLPFTAPEREEKRRIAFIAGSTLGFGMLRVVAAMRDYDGQITDVFREFRDAFDWIERPELGEVLPTAIDQLLTAVGGENEAPTDEFDIAIERA